MILVFAILVLFTITAEANDMTIVSPETAPFKWETGIKFGGAKFHEDTVTASWMPAVELSFDRRVTFPILMGISINGGINDDLWHVVLKPSFTVRIPLLPRTRADFKAGPIVYFYDDNTTQDLRPGLFGSISVKFFIKRHLSLEIGATEHIISDSALSNRFYYLGINY